MTIPFERTRSLILTKGFLQDLLDPKKTPRVPANIRSQAERLLMHYPTYMDIEQAHLLLPDLYGPVPPFSRLSGSGDVRVVIEAMIDPSRHRIQDAQSLLMHREAVRMLKEDPSLVARAQEILQRWMIVDSTRRSRRLLERWQAIISARDWEQALAQTDEGQQLRQASPLGCLLPDAVRLDIIRLLREDWNSAD